MIRNFWYIFFSVLLLSSCSASKKEYAVINDFLEYEMAGKPYDTIFVAKEKPDSEYTLQLYEWGFKEYPAYNPNYGKVWIEPLTDDWPIDDKEIAMLKGKLPDMVLEEWKNTDFKNKDFIIISKNETKKNEFINKHIGAKNHVFYISQPIFSKNSNHAIFYFAPTSTGIGRIYPFVNDGMKLMKKENGKWKLIATIKEQVYY